MNEEWRPIPGYEGIYQVSNLGRVRSLDRRTWNPRGRGFWASLKGQDLRAVSLPTGHLYVKLLRDGQASQRQIHRLVLEAFVGPCPDGLEACHGDGDPTNNALPNLRWDTRSANLRDAVRHGTHHHAKKTVCANGHPYSPENTYVNGSKRACRTCRREHSRRSYARHVEALQDGAA